MNGFLSCQLKIPLQTILLVSVESVRPCPQSRSKWVHTAYIHPVSLYYPGLSLLPSGIPPIEVCSSTQLDTYLLAHLLLRIGPLICLQISLPHHPVSSIPPLGVGPPPYDSCWPCGPGTAWDRSTACYRCHKTTSSRQKGPPSSLQHRQICMACIYLQEKGYISSGGSKY